MVHTGKHLDRQLFKAILALCEDVGTPRALAVKLLVQCGEWVQLQELKVRPSDYQDVGGLSDRVGPEPYWRDAMVTELLRKCDLPTSVDREGAAVRTFLQCERECAAPNRRFDLLVGDKTFYEGPSDLADSDFIVRVRKEVEKVLGNLPNGLTPRFSQGATYADTGALITIPDKMSSEPTIYKQSRCFLPMWGETSWARALVNDGRASDPLTVRGNIFFCVPKDGTKFRGCCKEASVSVTYQLDVDRILKIKLRRIGIDLETGKDLHMRLAREASVKGHLATIDMSNASDTLAKQVVKFTCSKNGWYELFNSLRATHTRVGAKWFRLEKFSSMGNGLTFGLETLIFACLARTVVTDEGGDPDLVKCYGDDLIVPSEHSLGVLKALRLFGFTPNTKKTFVEGPFRESCGGDYFDGTPVRAFYLENLPDEPQHYIAMANGLRRVASTDGVPPSRWDIVRRAWLRVLQLIPSDIARLRGPVSLGDIVIHDDEQHWQFAGAGQLREYGGRKFTAPSCWSGKWIFAYVPVPVVLPWHHWTPNVQLASCTLGYGSRGITPRGEVSGYRRQRVYIGPTSSWLPSG